MRENTNLQKLSSPCLTYVRLLLPVYQTVCVSCVARFFFSEEESFLFVDTTRVVYKENHSSYFSTRFTMDGEPIIAQVATKIDWKPLEKSFEKLAQTCEGKTTFNTHISRYIFHSLMSHSLHNRFKESNHRVLLCLWIESTNWLIGVLNIGIESTGS